MSNAEEPTKPDSPSAFELLHSHMEEIKAVCIEARDDSRNARDHSMAAHSVALKTQHEVELLKRRQVWLPTAIAAAAMLLSFASFALSVAALSR